MLASSCQWPPVSVSGSTGPLSVRGTLVKASVLQSTGEAIPCTSPGSRPCGCRACAGADGSHLPTSSFRMPLVREPNVADRGQSAACRRCAFEDPSNKMHRCRLQAISSRLEAIASRLEKRHTKRWKFRCNTTLSIFVSLKSDGVHHACTTCCVRRPV